MDKKWLFGIVTSIILIPTLIFGRDRISQVWASPEVIKTVDTKVDKNKTELDKVHELEVEISKLVIEQKARIDRNDALDELRAKNQAEQLLLIAELKKKK